MTKAPVAYQGYRVKLTWPVGSVDFIGTGPVSPGGLVACGGGGFQATDPVIFFDSCSQPPFSVATNFVGLLETITLRCAANGTFTIHTTNLSEDSFGGSAALQGDFFPQSPVLPLPGTKQQIHHFSFVPVRGPVESRGAVGLGRIRVRAFLEQSAYG